MSSAAKDHESAKERALRIPLDYVHGTDRLQRWKWKISVIAAVVTIGFGAWVMFAPRGKAAFSHGQLASVHAAWDTNCSTCHQDFLALRPDAANPLARFGLLSSKATQLKGQILRQQIDLKCQACHAGSPHHRKENELATDARTCVSCHTEHRGRHAEIARPVDMECTRCHEDIAAHRSIEDSVAIPAIENVSAFAISLGANPSKHPDFRSLASDPGNLKFNHHIHMQAGIPAPDSSQSPPASATAPDARGEAAGKKLLTLADLPVEFVERYRRPGQNAASDVTNAIQLECASCHQLKTSTSPLPEKSQVAIPSSGEYMMPIRYEVHCRACHPLNYEPAADKQLQHGLRPKEANESLYGRYAAEAKAIDETSGRLTPRRPIPGQRLEHATNEVSRSISEQVAAARRYLHETNACGKCHLSKTSGQTQVGLTDLQESAIPQVWFRHSRFDHTAHRTEKCELCHDTTSASTAPGRQDHDVVMIKGRDVCMSCHSPGGSDGSTGGARFDCVECHQYHRNL